MNNAKKNEPNGYGSNATESVPSATAWWCPHALRTYVSALRPWSFSVSLTPVVLGSCLAFKTVGSFSVIVFIVTCMTALAVHAAGNVVNTYFDYVRGVDTKKSDDRTLVDGCMEPSAVASLGGILYLIGCAGLLVLVFISPASLEHLALVYFGGLSSSFLYTGGLGLKYIALGDIVIFLTFGPLTVLFAYLSQAGSLSWIPLVYAIPLAFNTEAILHSNNTRDMESDKQAGIITLAIIIGRTASYVLFTFLLFTPYVIFTVIALHFSRWFILPLLTIFVTFKFEREFRRGSLSNMPHMMAVLNMKLGLLYTLACGLADVKYLPGFQ
ncbi:hypothetical protein NP493_250g00008 [Ridgeia piscesae]|uniref:1,4-dihydroxy-2-naphthoate octaprenyltransferase n=1 Tax=Ridgeia piscesae TaxID=27915 RepID=A0AAD9NYF9_RIDPI|nr:hypothetical protein NP493_250g00008 [Ridgeia piscesae]